MKAALRLLQNCFLEIGEKMKSRRRLGVGPLCMMGLMVLCAGIAIAQPNIICHGGVCDGTQGDDLMLGSAGADYIHAKGGTDGTNAAKGRDRVFGGRGNDDPGSSPNGHDPSYHLEGGPGRDVVRGGLGQDSVTDVFGPLNGQHADTDRLFGGPANDYLDAQDGDGLDHLNCGTGRRNAYSADPGDTVLSNCQKNVG
jgi:Ca2+-binding RTX toxin-like protein